MKHASLLLYLLTLQTGMLFADKRPAINHLYLDLVDTTRNRTVPVKIYLPPGHKEAYPVVIFSHGLGGSRDGASYLGEHWAENGFVAVYVQHPGSDVTVWKDASPGKKFDELKQAANFRSFKDRVVDITFVLDQLEAMDGDKGHALHGQVDLAHIGMSGHSFGGMTTQAIMGQVFPFGISYPDPRIKACLIMSPSEAKGIPAEKAFGQVHLPVLCMTGTDDRSPVDRTVTPESRLTVYKALPTGSAYQLVLDGAQHFVFSGPGGRRGKLVKPHMHAAIKELSTLFWKAYLCDDQSASKALRSDDVKKWLQNDDRWMWK